MLLEEFYNYESKKDEEKVQFFYTATLSSWLNYNNVDVYVALIDDFEEKEEYLICEGINRALSVIDDIMDRRFGEAASVKEDDEIFLTHEQHEKVSQLVFLDIMKEIYKSYITTYTEIDAEEKGSESN
jgi:hypothetical protein